MSDPSAGRDVCWLLDTWAARQPERPFLVWQPLADQRVTRWSYREFADAVERVALGMWEHGLREGDRLLVHLDNCPGFLLAWFAAARVGAVAVCTNTKSTQRELTYFTEHADVRGAVTQPSLCGIVEASAPSADWVACVDGELGTGDDGDGLSSLSLRHLLHTSAGRAPRPVPCPSRAVSIQYTSGTTALPKAVVWSSANVLWGAKVSAAHEGLRNDDVHLVHLPLFHTNAQMYSILATLWAGATAVLMPRFSASRFWDVSLRHRCTWTSVVPFCVRALREHDVPGEHSYRLWGNGVSRPPEDDRFGVHTIGWFGMTETVTHCTVDDVEHPGRALGMGRPAPEYRVRVVDDDGRAVQVEETGALEVMGVQGSSLFAEYLHEPDATRAAFTDDGWFRTGDRATVHADGYLSFAGRAKDVMRVGSENVSPAEIERVISLVPGVKESAVVGAPDELLGETPVAFVIVHEGSAATMQTSILDRCREELASFKVPREVRFVDELPRSTLNKVAKVELRRSLERERSSPS